MKKTITSSVLAIALLGAVFAAKADAPATPANPLATATTPTSINLSWDAVSGVAGYDIYRNGTSTIFATTSTANYTDSGLAPSTLYTYYVDAYDASNTKSVLSAAFSTTTLADTATPTVPTIVNANPVSSSRINLTWTAASDNVGVTGYNVYRDNTLVGTSSSLNYSDTGLAASTSYSYTVAAFDAASNLSGRSNAVVATTLASSTDTSAPSAPTGPIATPISSSQINIAWTASTDNTAVAGYRIFRNGTQVGTTTNVYFTDNGLTATTSYTYNVSAFDAAGNTSAASAEVTATTLGIGQTASSNVTIQVLNGDKRGKQINYRSNEIIKVVVYSTNGFSAKTIVNSSVLFGGAKAIGWQLKDVNRDGMTDRIYSFRAKDLKNLNGENNILVFSATTNDGRQVYSSAAFRVKNAPNRYRASLERKINELQKKLSELRSRLNQHIVKGEINKPAQVEREEEKKSVQAKKAEVKKAETKKPAQVKNNNVKKNNKSGKK